jgi:SAM-dependent methyltransferase
MAAAQALLDFMHAYEDEAAYAEFEKCSDFTSYYEFFSPRVLRFAWAMEDRTFDEMMSKKLAADQKLGDILGPHSWDAYSRMADVLNLVEFSSSCRYVIAGCGKLPASLFYLHDWTAADCLVGIDNDVKAVESARKIVAHFGLNRIQIDHADGIDFDYSSFDIIYWGPFANPRLKVMERILSTAKRDSIIILRDPFHTGTLANKGVLAELDPRFEICKVSDAHPGRFMLKHYILRLN